MRKDTQIIKAITFDIIWLLFAILFVFTLGKDIPDMYRYSLVLVTVLRIFIEMAQTVYNRIEKAEVNILEAINKNNRTSL